MAEALDLSIKCIWHWLMDFRSVLGFGTKDQRLETRPNAWSDSHLGFNTRRRFSEAGLFSR